MVGQDSDIVPMKTLHMKHYDLSIIPSADEIMSLVEPLVGDLNGISRGKENRSMLCVSVLSMAKNIIPTVGIPPEANYVLEQYREGNISERDIHPSVMGLLQIPANLQFAHHQPHLFVDDHIVRLEEYLFNRADVDYPYVITTLSTSTLVVQFSCLKSKLSETVSQSGRELSDEITHQIKLQMKTVAGPDSIMLENGFYISIHPNGNVSRYIFNKDGDPVIGGCNYSTEGVQLERFKEYPNGDILVTILKEDGTVEKFHRMARLGKSWIYIPILRTIGHSSGQEHDYPKIRDPRIPPPVLELLQRVANVVDVRKFESMEEYMQAVLLAGLLN